MFPSAGDTILGGMAGRTSWFVGLAWKDQRTTFREEPGELLRIYGFGVLLTAQDWSIPVSHLNAALLLFNTLITAKTNLWL